MNEIPKLKMVVDIDEFVRHKNYFHSINSVQIEDITWMQNGKELCPNPDILCEWKFMGLNNSDFPGTLGWAMSGDKGKGFSSPIL
jgi:hypothetical protein